jgi:hypothetical protein
MLKDRNTYIKFHLTKRQLDQFEQDGFIVLRSVIPDEEIQRIRQLIRHLFEQFTNLPKALAYDMSECPYPVSTLQNPQVARCLQLEPKLANLQYLQNATAIARELLGLHARLCFDHAILKPPFSNCPTAWHQDEAYDKPGDSKQRLSFWLPLQDVSPDAGCLQYIPGSHKQELVPHHSLAVGSKALTAKDVNLEQAVACPVKVGDLIIHSGRTLHYAGGNITPTNRLAWILVFAAINKSPRARLKRLASRVLHQVVKV